MGDGGKYFSAMSEREREALKREAQLRKYIYIYIYFSFFGQETIKHVYRFRRRNR